MKIVRETEDQIILEVNYLGYAILALVMLLFLGLYPLFSGGYTEIKCDKARNLCKITKNNFYSTNVQKISLNEIKNIILIKNVSYISSSYKYNLYFETTSGSFYLFNNIITDRSFVANVQSRIENFIKNKDISSLEEKYDTRMIYLFTLILIILGLMVLSFGVYKDIFVLDKLSGSFTINRKGLFKKNKKYELDDIQEVTIEKYEFRFPPRYRLVFKMKSGHKEYSDFYITVKDVENLKDIVNNFLGIESV